MSEFAEEPDEGDVDDPQEVLPDLNDPSQLPPDEGDNPSLANVDGTDNA